MPRIQPPPGAGDASPAPGPAPAPPAGAAAPAQGPARTVRFRWGAGGEGGGRELQPALLYSGAALAVLLLVALALVAGAGRRGPVATPATESTPAEDQPGGQTGAPAPAPPGGATRGGGARP